LVVKSWLPEGVFNDALDDVRDTDDVDVVLVAVPHDARRIEPLSIWATSKRLDMKRLLNAEVGQWFRRLCARITLSMP
jgi:hypothetical protein